jgi:hypothetical protein
VSQLGKQEKVAAKYNTYESIYHESVAQAIPSTAFLPLLSNLTILAQLVDYLAWLFKKD